MDTDKFEPEFTYPTPASTPPAALLAGTISEKDEQIKLGTIMKLNKALYYKVFGDHPYFSKKELNSALQAIGSRPVSLMNPVV